MIKLKDLGKIETHYDSSIPRGYLIQGVNQGVNRVSIPIRLTGIDTLLTPYLIGENPYEKKVIKPIIFNFSDKKRENEKKNKKNTHICEKIDTLKIDTLNLQKCTDKKISPQKIIKK